MRIIVDTTKCEAHGDCVLAAPTVFDLDDDDNVVVVLDASPGEERRSEAEKAASLCPVGAISIAE